MAGRRIYINPDTAGANAHHRNRLNPGITKGPRREYPMGDT